MCFNMLVSCSFINPPVDDNTPPTGNDGGVDETPDVQEFDRKYLYGLGEPLISSNVNAFSTEKSIDLAGALGAKSYRMWFLASDLFSGFSYGKVSHARHLPTIVYHFIGKI